MSKGFVIVANSSVFILEITMDQLKSKGYSYETAIFKTEDISEKAKEYNYFIIYCDDEARNHKLELEFINNACLLQKKQVVLIGNEDAVEEIKKRFHENSVAAIVTRPFTSKEIKTALGAIYNEEFEDASMSSKSGRKRILVVDDSGPTLLTIKRWLEGKYDVSVVNSARNALTFLEMKGTDLILLDYEMPVKNGREMLEELHNNPDLKNIPVIFLSGKADAHIVSEILDLKPQGYLLKSMPSEDIVERIDEFFASWEENE